MHIRDKSPVKDFQGKKIKSIDDLINLLIDLQLWEKNQKIELTSKLKLTSNLNKDQRSALINCLKNPSKPSNPIKEFSELHKLISNLEQKLAKLEEKVEKPTDLINPLLPLITELLRLKASESQELLFQAAVPIIDQVIKQKSAENLEQMSEAIATLLPCAIATKIKQSPQQIAEAIAPEIALAMEKQIVLDQYAIAKALESQMGEAIKNQIKYERDAMIDALYPVIGNTIIKYMADLVQSINDKVEKAFTFEGIKRKIKAKIQGISEAELIFQETIDYHVQAVFLIHKASGLVVAQVQNPLKETFDADMLSAMLTAIRSFANDCFNVSGKDSELQEIEYDDSKIILEVAGYCYLAVLVKGNPSQLFLQKLKKTMSKIILDYGNLIASFEGDQSTIPDTIRLQLEKLLESKAKVVEKSKPPLALLFLLLAFIFPLGMIWYRHEVANRLETEITMALDATPELSIYRLIPQVNKGKITLTGRLPNELLRKQAGEVAKAISPDLPLDNQIIAVKVPPDPIWTAGEVERVTKLLNQRKGITISSRYQKNMVIVEGIVPEASDREQTIQAFKDIPGVEIVLFTGLTISPLNQK